MLLGGLTPRIWWPQRQALEVGTLKRSSQHYYWLLKIAEDVPQSKDQWPASEAGHMMSHAAHQRHRHVNPPLILSSLTHSFPQSQEQRKASEAGRNIVQLTKQLAEEVYGSKAAVRERSYKPADAEVIRCAFVIANLLKTD